MNRATAQMALEALNCALKAFEFIDGCRGVAILDPIGLRENLSSSAEAIAAIEADLAQPVEPIANITVQGGKCTYTRSADFRKVPDGDCSLYTPSPEPVNAELLEACRRLLGGYHALGFENDPSAEFARAVIAKATGAAS